MHAVSPMAQLKEHDAKMLKLVLDKMRELAPERQPEPESLVTEAGRLAYARECGATDLVKRVAAALKQKMGG